VPSCPTRYKRDSPCRTAPAPKLGRTELAATRTRPADAVSTSSSREGDLRIHPRRGLPGGRAVVGGFLVAVAAVGVFAAVTGSSQGPSTDYVVAAHDLPAGRVLTLDDLDTVALDLPADQASGAYRYPPSLIGTITLSPLAAGELVQASAIGEPVADGVPTVAMSLPAAAALGGDLRPGDLVDAYVTFGSEVEATTELVVPGATVVAVSSPTDDVVAEAGQVQVRLAVPDPAQRIELVNAVNAGAVTLAGVTGGEATGRAGDRFPPAGEP
jgi:Flp pilus assembly protein CpaB